MSVFHRGCSCLATKSCPTLCNPMDCSMPGFSVLRYILEFTETYVHWVGDAIHLSHPLSSSSPSVLNLSQHQRLFQWVSSSHQVAKILELQLQSFQWIFRIDLLWIDWFNLLSVPGIVQVHYPLITGYNHMVFDLLLSMLIYSNNKLLLTTYSVSVEQCPGNAWSQRNWKKKKKKKQNRGVTE